jgi:hypothetical protein
LALPWPADTADAVEEVTTINTNGRIVFIPSFS